MCIIDFEVICCHKLGCSDLASEMGRRMERSSSKLDWIFQEQAHLEEDAYDTIFQLVLIQDTVCASPSLREVWAWNPIAVLARVGLPAER
jgi:hypothetical protein